MSNLKTDTGTVIQEITKSTGSGSRKTTDAMNIGETEQHHSKKTTPTQHQPNTKQHKERNRSVSNNGGGGRISSHSHKKPDRYKKDAATEHGSGGRHDRNKLGTKDGWSGHNRVSKTSGGGENSRRGYKTHSSKGTKVFLEESGNTDSGISEGSSPEGLAIGQKNDGKALIEGQPSENTESANNNADNVFESDSNKNATETKDVAVKHRNIYDREFLLSVRNCTRSLITPIGFDQLPSETSKDVLKGSHRHCSTDDKEDGNSDTGENEPSSNPGGSTLSFNRDFDQKVKISLMPQRRSFGSGCSWRDAANTSSNKPTTPVVEADEQSIKDDSNTDPQPQGGNWYNQHGGPTRVIDHVPYRSRQGNSEWKPTKGNAWRGRTINDEYYEEEEEPEWMSFGPSDRYELMELKGIDEHETEREARREPKPFFKTDDKSSPEDSPSSSPLDKDVPKSDLVDSGLPSSCPNDDDDEFILDGFDFKSVLSICRELASDDSHHDDEEQLSTIKDSTELKNALISVLGITKEDNESDDDRVDGGPSSKTQQVNNVTTVRPMTLEEIEAENDTTPLVVAANDNIDQSAFNKFLASIHQPKSRDAHLNVMAADSDSSLIIPPQIVNRSSHFSDKSDHSIPTQYNSDYPSPAHHTHNSPNPLYSPSTPYNHGPRHNDHTHHHAHQSGGWSPGASWPSDDTHKHSSHLLNPSPSSLGMHPHHLRQKQQHSSLEYGTNSSNNWASEMERIRLSELNQMRYYRQRDDRQARMMQQQQSVQQQKQQQSSVSAPSLSFLPTSVMRHIHNSKPNQSIKDVTRTLSHSRMDHDYLPEPGSSYAPHSTEGPYHHRPLHQSPSPQYHYPSHYQYAASYRPNLRGGLPALDQGGMYHSQQQYMRPGSSSDNSGLY